MYLHVIPENAFQSTLPAWGATNLLGLSKETTYISIHAPRMGSDVFKRSEYHEHQFQSTLPAWGATIA